MPRPSQQIDQALLASGRTLLPQTGCAGLSVRALAEQKGRREAGRSGGGGRMTLGYFEGKSPEYHGVEAARQALAWARDGDLLLLTVHADRDTVLRYLQRLAAEGWTAGKPLPA